MPILKTEVEFEAYCDECNHGMCDHIVVKGTTLYIKPCHCAEPTEKDKKENEHLRSEIRQLYKKLAEFDYYPTIPEIYRFKHNYNFNLLE